LSNDETETDFGDPPDLGQAGAAVEQMIRAMMEQDLDPLVVASALLAGSLGLLVDTIGTEATVQVLQNALTSVEDGEFGDDEDMDDDEEEEAPPPPPPPAQKKALPGKPAPGKLAPGKPTLKKPGGH
jgi:hypothetical protein